MEQLKEEVMLANNGDNYNVSRSTIADQKWTGFTEVAEEDNVSLVTAQGRFNGTWKQ